MCCLPLLILFVGLIAFGFIVLKTNQRYGVNGLLLTIPVHFLIQIVASCIVDRHRLQCPDANPDDLGDGPSD